ncbi:MAG: Hg(II)-responsive transcriptional regulator [Polyangiales bacterium]
MAVDMEPSTRTIGALARDAGVHVETVRYYERRGLLKQPRRGAGWRRYDEAALHALQFVKRAQELGFSLDEVADLLSLRSSSSERTCMRVRARAEAKLADIDAKLRDLASMRATLERLTRACPSDGPAGRCPILGAIGAAPECKGGCSDG